MDTVAASRHPDNEALLRQALIEGTEATVRALTAAGPDAIGVFEAFLSGSVDLGLPNVGRDEVDNLMTVSLTLARAYPAQYVGTFNSARWQDNGTVLAGLGYTADPAVVAVLVAALSGDGGWPTRMDAARALRYLPGPESQAALIRGLGDSQGLVRHHAAQALGVIGDEAALSPLEALIADDPARSSVARRSIELIRERTSTNG
jgi:HEAT repeat protein